MADFTSKRSFEDCPKKHKNIIHIYEVVLFLFGNTVFYNFYSDLYSTLLSSDKACHKSSLTTLPYLFSFKYFFIPVIKSSSPSQLLIIPRIEAPYNINTEITIIYVILKSKQYRIVVSRVSTLYLTFPTLLYETQPNSLSGTSTGWSKTGVFVKSSHFIP